MNMHAFSALPRTGDLIISYLPWLFVIAAVIIAIVVGFLLYSRQKAVKANYASRHAAKASHSQERSAQTTAGPVAHSAAPEPAGESMVSAPTAPGSTPTRATAASAQQAQVPTSKPVVSSSASEEGDRPFTGPQGDSQQ